MVSRKKVKDLADMQLKSYLIGRMLNGMLNFPTGVEKSKVEGTDIKYTLRKPVDKDEIINHALTLAMDAMSIYALDKKKSGRRR